MTTGFVLRSIVFHLRKEYFLMFPFNWLQCLFLSSFERINGKVALLSLRMCRMSPCGKFQGEKYQKEKKKNIWEPQPTVKWNGKAFHMKRPPIARSRDYFENNNRSKYFELCVGKVAIVGLTWLANETTVSVAFSICSSKFYSSIWISKKKNATG